MAIDRTAGHLEWHDFAELNIGALYELLRFRQAIFVVEQSSPYADLDGLDQRSHHLLLRADGALTGYLRLIPWTAEQRIAIGRVSIGAAARGQGLAATLMQAALDRCSRDYPDYRITLSAQTYLVPFYERLGFRVTSAPYDDCGVAHIDMTLPPAG